MDIVCVNLLHVCINMNVFQKWDSLFDEDDTPCVTGMVCIFTKGLSTRAILGRLYFMMLCHPTYLDQYSSCKHPHDTFSCDF